MSSFLFRRVDLFFLVVSAMVIICGCANNAETTLPVNLMAVKKPHNDNKRPALNVTELVDRRFNKAIGISNGKSVVSIDDPMVWIRSSLQNRGYRIATEGGFREEKALCNFSLELNILDFQTSNTNKSANAVLTLKNETFPTGKVIRGQFTGSMWVGNDKEVANTIRKSLGRAIDKLDDAVQESCP